jgi:hypothetical protein
LGKLHHSLLDFGLCFSGLILVASFIRYTVFGSCHSVSLSVDLSVAFRKFKSHLAPKNSVSALWFSLRFRILSVHYTLRVGSKTWSSLRGGAYLVLSPSRGGRRQ